MSTVVLPFLSEALASLWAPAPLSCALLALLPWHYPLQPSRCHHCASTSSSTEERGVPANRPSGASPAPAFPHGGSLASAPPVGDCRPSRPPPGAGAVLPRGVPLRGVPSPSAPASLSWSSLSPSPAPTILSDLLFLSCFCRAPVPLPRSSVSPETFSASHPCVAARTPKHRFLVPAWPPATPHAEGGGRGALGSGGRAPWARVTEAAVPAVRLPAKPPRGAFARPPRTGWDPRVCKSASERAGRAAPQVLSFCCHLASRGQILRLDGTSWRVRKRDKWLHKQSQWSLLRSNTMIRNIHFFKKQELFKGS